MAHLGQADIEHTGCCCPTGILSIPGSPEDWCLESTHRPALNCDRCEPELRTPAYEPPLRFRLWGLGGRCEHWQSCGGEHKRWIREGGLRRIIEHPVPESVNPRTNASLLPGWSGRGFPVCEKGVPASRAALKRDARCIVPGGPRRRWSRVFLAVG